MGQVRARPERTILKTVVFGEHSQLKSIKGKLLKLGARPALMSGSGSALFGMFPSRELRDRALDSFRKEFDKDKVHPRDYGEPQPLSRNVEAASGSYFRH